MKPLSFPPVFRRSAACLPNVSLGAIGLGSQTPHISISDLESTAHGDQTLNTVPSFLCRLAHAQVGIFFGPMILPLGGSLEKDIPHV